MQLCKLPLANAHETTAYQWISGHNFRPQFLGHLTEKNGRVIGPLMECITDAQHAGAEDI
jgi:hypothetical protein